MGERGEFGALIVHRGRKLGGRSGADNLAQTLQARRDGGVRDDRADVCGDTLTECIRHSLSSKDADETVIFQRGVAGLPDSGDRWYERRALAVGDCEQLELSGGHLRHRGYNRRQEYLNASL